jgi:hypothetical protein
MKRWYDMQGYNVQERDSTMLKRLAEIEDMVDAGDIHDADNALCGLLLECKFLPRSYSVALGLEERIVDALIAAS